MLKLVFERKPSAEGGVAVTVGAWWTSPEEAKVCEAVLSSLGSAAVISGPDCRCARSCSSCSGGCPASRPEPRTGLGPAATPQG